MQKTLTALALSAITSGVEARRGNRQISDDHPFMNSDDQVVFHKDGGSSHLAEPMADVVRKYDEIISHKDFKKTHKSAL